MVVVLVMLGGGGDNDDVDDDGDDGGDDDDDDGEVNDWEKTETLSHSFKFLFFGVGGINNRICCVKLTGAHASV